MKLNTFNIILVSVFVFLFFFTIAHGFYVIYIAKDFDYLIETSCNPGDEECFERDCTNPEDCPPNQLSAYKQFLIKAKYFPQCTDNSCANLYEINSSLFTSVECDEENGDMCTKPEVFNITQ